MHNWRLRNSSHEYSYAIALCCLETGSKGNSMGLILEARKTPLFGSVAYGKAASSCSQKSCQRDQTRRCEVGCRRSENVEAPGSLGMASNDDTSINRVKHLGLHDLEMSMAGQ